MWGQVVSPTRIYSSWAFVSETDVCIWPTQLLLQRSNLRKQLSTFGIQLLCVERQLIFSKAKKTVTHWLANLNQISCPWAQRVPSSPSYKRAVGSGIIHAFITLFWGLPPIALWPQCCVRWSVQEHHQIHRRIERRHHSWRAAFWGAISWGRLQSQGGELTNAKFPSRWFCTWRTGQHKVFLEIQMICVEYKPIGALPGRDYVLVLYY